MVKIIRENIILIIGIISFSICSFLPVIKACYDVDIKGDVTYLYVYGFENFDYYSCLVFTTIILFISLLRFERSYIYISLILVVLMFLTLIVYRFLSLAGWGRPCGSLPYYFYFLMIFGSTLVIISSFITLNRKKTMLAKSIEDL
ncbi:MAG: hypothetical protein ACK46Y_05045 [Fluviicola sp.]